MSQLATATAQILPRLRKMRELILYVAFGLTALAVELGVFYVFVSILESSILLSNLLAIVSGMLISFGLNAVFNFKVNNNLIKRFAQYAIVVSIGYVLSSAIILGLVELGSAAFVAKVLALPVVFIVQFTLNKRFTFSS